MKTCISRWTSRWCARLQVSASERGDVPGWVLVTVMTAGLVTALWLLADSQLKSVLSNAMNSVAR
jgi:hypothetical protein